jgi:hypothetical protein
MSGDTTTDPERWEVHIKDALAGSREGDAAGVIAAVGIEIVRAIRESGQAPVPDEIIEALVPVSSAELEAMGKRNPAQAEFFAAMAAVRRGIEM